MKILLGKSTWLYNTWYNRNTISATKTISGSWRTSKL